MSEPLPPGHLAVYYHTHWDREWYLPFRSYQVRLVEVIDDILVQLEQGLLKCFMLDGQTVILEDYLELRPHNRERLKILIETKKITIGPWYVMPDEFLVSGESLIRNLQQGIETSKAWGCFDFTGYLPDTFGHSADIPTLLTGFGIETAVVWRGVSPESSLFYWQSVSQQKVLTLHLTDGYFQMPLQDWTLSPQEKQVALQSVINKLQQANPLRTHPVLLPLGGDHLPLATPEERNLLHEICPNVMETTPDQFLAHIQQARPEGLNTLPCLMGELTSNETSFLLPGVYSSRLYLKQQNRALEHLLVHQLEPLMAMAELFRLKYAANPNHTRPHQLFCHSDLSASLALAWKQLLLNHPHDSICGCSVDAVHRENEQRFEQVTQLANALWQRAMLQIWHCMNACTTDMIVLNTSATTYTGVVPVCLDTTEPDILAFLPQQNTVETVLQDEYLYNIRRIPLSHLTQKRQTGWIWVNDLAPFGVLKLLQSAMPNVPARQAVKQTPWSLSNKFLQIMVDPALGTIQIATEVIEADSKETQQTLSQGESFRPVSSNLFVLRAIPEQGDSYNGAPIPNQPSCLAKFVAVVNLPAVSSGELSGTLGLQFRFDNLGCNNSSVDFIVQLTLQAGSPLLHIEVKHPGLVMPNHTLQIAFETQKPIRDIEAESHFSSVTRTVDPNYSLQAQMPALPYKELKTRTGVIQRFVSTNGQSWITRGLTEYEVSDSIVKGSVLGITLHRPFRLLSSKETGVRGAQAGPPFETPEGLCLNRPLHCELAWLITPKETSQLYTLTEQYLGSVWGISKPDSPGEQQVSHPAADTIMQQATLPTATTSRLISWPDAQALVKLACYWLPDKGLVLRVLNTTAKSVETRFLVHFNCSGIQPVNLMNEPVPCQGNPAEPNPLPVESPCTVDAFAIQSFLFITG